MAASGLSQKNIVVLDGEGLVAGRLASCVSKLLLDGNKVMVVNAEKTLLSGSRKAILNEWLKRLEIASVVHPKYGPFHPRSPDGIFRRMVRGMIPRRRPKGIAAMKRLRVYVGVPERYKGLPRKSLEDVSARKPLAYYVSLSELAKSIGWRGV